MFKPLTYNLLLVLQFSTFTVSIDVEIPLGGNAFITQRSMMGDGVVNYQNSGKGLGAWQNEQTICSVYFKLARPEHFQLQLRLKVSPLGSSFIRISINRRSYVQRITGSDFHIQDIGRFNVKKAGYVKLDLQGINKTDGGFYFGDVDSAILSGVKGKVDYVSLPNFLYGRRGPSIHLDFHPVVFGDIEYFYSELMVPKEPPNSSFFMATGFSNGYFGIQRVTDTEKWILFSVFSDFVSQDSSMVKADYRVTLQKQGRDVTVKEFGHEGSGLQSILIFPWKAGANYKFIVCGTPSGPNTTYTAWFRAPNSDWRLVASLQKPKVSAYLNGLYSFSENFEGNQGYLDRKAYYGNQWVRTTYLGGFWQEVTKADVYADPTGEKNGREDYAGGLTKNKKMFYLRNIGFFNKQTMSPTTFTRKATDRKPDVEVEQLPLK